MLDPDPRAIVNKFVLEENAGKFGAPGDYLKNFFWGGSSIWRLMVSYPLNAGLLMFPVIALFVDAFRRRAELLKVRLKPDTTPRLEADTTADAEAQLWMWVVTLFVVFSLPSQRDERYLLPAMPALAVLCALNWHRISERVFKISLAITGVVVVLLAYLSMRLEQAVAGDRLFPFTYWAVLAVAFILVIAAMLRPGLARVSVNVAILLALAGFAGFLHPFDGAPGTYSVDIQQLTRGRTVWVPINFAAKEEAHRFLLPGADVHGYAGEPDFTIAGPGPHSALFAVRAPINSTPVGGGRVLGERLDIATRQTPNQILDMAILHRVRGDVAEAKKNYEESLVIRRAIGDKAGVAATLNNLANLMSDEGDLTGAMKVYDETLKTAEELGDKRSVAMAWYNMGEMERLQGHLTKSRSLLDQALALRRSLEDRSAVARTVTSIGMVLAVQARLPEARKSYEEALALQEGVGDKLGIARVRNLLGVLALHEGRPAEAQTSIRQAATQLHELKALDEEAAALAGLVPALLAERKNQEAERAIQDATRLVKDSRNRQWRLEVDLALARVEAATGKLDAASTRLRKLQGDAKGFVGFELDAGLALAEVEIASGQVAQGRARLATIEQQAKANGFLLTASQAAAAQR